MDKIEILKSIDIELQQRLDVLNTNNISREKAFWSDSIRGPQAAFTEAYDFLLSTPINHKGMTQEQYLAHCLRVSALAMHFSDGDFEKTGITALIHNVYEISSIKEGDIIKKFGIEISEALSALRIDRELQRDPEYLKAYYQKLNQQHDYLGKIKVLDKLDNLFVLGLNPDDDIREIYLEETKTHVLPMAQRIDDKIAEYMEDLIIFNKKTGHIKSQTQ